jgi:hypothetical protein
LDLGFHKVLCRGSDQREDLSLEENLMKTQIFLEDLLKCSLSGVNPLNCYELLHKTLKLKMFFSPIVVEVSFNQLFTTLRAKISRGYLFARVSSKDKIKCYIKRA